MFVLFRQIVAFSGGTPRDVALGRQRLMTDAYTSCVNSSPTRKYMEYQNNTAAMPKHSTASNAISNLYVARLMSPEEVNGATLVQPEFVRERVRNKWSLCGDVNEKIFELLTKYRGGILPVRITAYRTPAGGAYAVMTHQLDGGFQHRFLLPLYVPQVAKFLAAMDHDELLFLLGKNGEIAAVVLECPLTNVQLLPLQGMARSLQHSKMTEVADEFPLVVQTILNVLQVPSLFKGETVHGVSLSVLLPDAAMQGWSSGKGKHRERNEASNT